MRPFTTLKALLMLSGLLATNAAMAENIDLLMTGLFPQGQATYIGYDSVERADIPETAAIDRKYLIVDFRFHNPMADEQLQASVHKVCMTLLRDRELIHRLSDAGYDMVSVAFDRQTQFDCL